MITDFSMRVEYVVPCSGEDCEGKHVETFMVWRQTELRRVNLPSDWSVVNGQPYCSQHQVYVESPNSDPQRLPRRIFP